MLNLLANSLRIVSVSVAATRYTSAPANEAILDIMKGKNAFNIIRSLGLSVPKEFAANGSPANAEKPWLENPLIEFKNAYFTYPARPTQPVLRGLDLKVKRCHTCIDSEQLLIIFTVQEGAVRRSSWLFRMWQVDSLRAFGKVTCFSLPRTL